MNGRPFDKLRVSGKISHQSKVVELLRRVDKLPCHSGLEPESRRFESNNDLVHILIDSGLRRNDENFDLVHTP